MRIFISYSTKNEEIANYLRNALMITMRYECWMAPYSIEPGENYAKSIPPAIRECDVFILILSRESQLSTYVPIEVDFAVRYSRFIIPFHIDDAELNDEFDFFLSRRQRIEAFQRLNEATNELMRKLLRLDGFGRDGLESNSNDCSPAFDDNAVDSPCGVVDVSAPIASLRDKSLFSRLRDSLYESCGANKFLLGPKPSNAEFFSEVLPVGFPVAPDILFTSPIPDTAVISGYEWLTDLSGIRIEQLRNKCMRYAKRFDALALEETGIRLFKSEDPRYSGKLSSRFLSYSNGSKGRALSYLVLWALLGGDSYLALCSLLRL